MKHLSHGRTLEPIEFDELPVAHELHGTFAWAQWASAGGELPSGVRVPATPLERAWESTVPLDLHSNFMPTVPQPL